MPRLLTILAAILFVATGCTPESTDPGTTVHAASAPDRYAVLVAPSMSEQAAKAALEAVVELGLSSAPMSTVELVEAATPRTVASFTAPEDPDRDRRLRLIAKDEAFQRMQAFVRKALEVQDGQQDQIRLPQALTVVAKRGGSTKVLVFADPCYRSTDDPAFCFGDGVYPGGGFLRASPRDSIYGSKGVERELDGLTVYFCHLGRGLRDSLYEGHVSEFWGLHLSLKGGVLAAFEPDGGEVIRLALEGVTEPALKSWTLKPEDTGFVMHTDMGPQTVRPDLPIAPIGARLVIIQDTSGSAGQALELSRKAALSIMDKASRGTSPLHLGIVLSGDSENTAVLKLKPLHRDERGLQEEALEAAREFLEGKAKPDGSRANPQMQSFGATIDFVHGLGRALDQLEVGAATTTPLLVLVGDQGSVEGREKPEVRAQALERLRAFTQANPSTHILVVFTPGFGNVSSGYGEASATFFKEVAAAAGQLGTMANDPTWIEPWVEKVLAGQGGTR